MNTPEQKAQNATTPVTAPIAPAAAQEAVTTQAPAAAKGDDNLMSQPPKKS